MGGAQCAQYCVLCTSHVHDSVHVVHRIVLKHDVVVRKVVRNVVAII